MSTYYYLTTKYLRYKDKMKLYYISNVVIAIKEETNAGFFDNQKVLCLSIFNMLLNDPRNIYLIDI